MPSASEHRLWQARSLGFSLNPACPHPLHWEQEGEHTNLLDQKENEMPNPPAQDQRAHIALRAPGWGGACMKSWTKPPDTCPLATTAVSSLEPPEPKDPGTNNVPQACMSHLSSRVSFFCIYKSAFHHASHALPAPSLPLVTAHFFSCHLSKPQREQNVGSLVAVTQPCLHTSPKPFYLLPSWLFQSSLV